MACRGATTFLTRISGRNCSILKSKTFIKNAHVPSATSLIGQHPKLHSSPSRGVNTASAGQLLKSYAETNPHMDVVRYHHKNIKWSFKHIDHYSNALACGFLEQGLIPGDIVLSWLPSHFQELHVLQFTCSKAGFVLYNLDPSQAITDPEGAKDSLKHALEITKANILVSQDAGDDTNYVRLVHQLIPETVIFDFGLGVPFISPRFPHVRFPVHTGFDISGNPGMVPLKHMLSPTDNYETWVKDYDLNGSTPLMGEFVMKDGLPKLGRVLTNDEVVKEKKWPILASILNKEYSEVEGVGVVF